MRHIKLFEAYNADKVQSEYDDIMDGAGWATDGYIDNFSPLNKEEKYQLMLKLAKSGKLFDEDIIGDDDSGEMPKKGKMSVKDVEENWSYSKKK